MPCRLTGKPLHSGCRSYEGSNPSGATVGLSFHFMLTETDCQFFSCINGFQHTIRATHQPTGKSVEHESRLTGKKDRDDDIRIKARTLVLKKLERLMA